MDYVLINNMQRNEESVCFNYWEKGNSYFYALQTVLEIYTAILVTQEIAYVKVQKWRN